MAGYKRTDTTNNIATGNIINAADLDNEFDAVQAAYDETTGHTHGGALGEGAPITKVGPVQDVVVSGSAVTPKSDNVMDLGSPSLEFKDLYIDGTANIDSLVADTADINGGTVDGVVIGGSSAAAGSFTNLAYTGTLTGGAGVINIGSGQIYKDSSGNIGIGTTSPSSLGKLAVVGGYIVANGGGTLDPEFRLSGASGGVTRNYAMGTDGSQRLYWYDYTAAAYRMVINPSGNVGIGTGSPSQTLEVYNATSGIIRISTGSGASQLQLNSSGTNAAYINYNFGGAGALSFYDSNATSERMRIDSSGNVGIGTSSAGSKLTVNAGSLGTTSGSVKYLQALYLSTTNSDGLETLCSRSTTDTGWTSADFIFRRNVDGSAAQQSMTFAGDNTLRLATSGAERMRIDPSGNVGIGLTNPSSVLQLNRSGSTETAVKFTNGGGASSGFVVGASSAGAGLVYHIDSQPILFATANTERMRIDASGNVGIGIVSPTCRLQIDGTNVGYRGQLSLNGGANNISQLTLYNGATTQTNLTGQFYSSGDNVGVRLSAFQATGYLAFETNNNTERMRIDSSGKVGIGISNPPVILSVYGNGMTGWSWLAGNSTNPPASCTFGALFGTNLSQGNSETNLVWGQGVNSQQYFAIGKWTGSAYSEQMRIDSSGNLLVGTNAVGGKLYVVYADNSQAVIRGDATNVSLSGTVIVPLAARSATSAYSFIQAYSGSGADLEFNFRGDGNAYADGTFNNNGADYAEYFESATGQSIPVGSTVVLENNKVRLATELDNASDVVGVVRPKEAGKASMVVGNTAWNKWSNKYLTDDFDRFIMEDHDALEWIDEEGKQHSYESHNVPQDVVVPVDAVVKTHDDKGNKFQHYKINPEWNPDSVYINRENRDEWLIIGLIGQVKVLKGQQVGSRWVKMRDVSANVEEWFIR